MKNALRKIAIFSGFYLTFPLILFAVVCITEYFSLGTSVSVVGVIVVFVSYVTHLFCLNTTRRDEEEFRYRNLACCAVAFYLLLLSLRSYYEGNEITLSIGVLYVGLVVIAAIIAVMKKKKNLDGKIQFFLNLTTIFTSLLFLYVFWASQWIWVVSVMTCVLLILQMNPILEKGFKVQAYVFIASICFVFSVASSIFQFWSVPVIGQITLGWTLTGGIVGTAILALFGYLVNLSWHNWQEGKNEKEQIRIADQERDAQENKRVRLQRQLIERHKVLIEAEKNTFEEYCELYDIQGNQNFPLGQRVSLLKKALSLNFSDIVELSTVKKQIFWDKSRFDTLLNFLNITTKQSRNDSELESLVVWMKQFQAQLEAHNDYVGYDACKNTLTLCNCLYELANPEVKKVQ